MAALVPRLTPGWSVIGRKPVARTNPLSGWGAAEQQYVRAIELNPSHVEAHLFYSHLLSALRRFDEARRQADIALELDPFNSFSRGLVGFVSLWMGEVDDAIRQFETALRAAPRFPLALRGLWMCFSSLGRRDEALAAASELFESYGDDAVVDALRRGYAEGGFTGAMGAAADTLASRAPTVFVKPIQVAIFSDLSGDTERALQWFERSYAARDSDMVYSGVNPFSDRLRATPEFRDLLRRMNLPGGDDGRMSK
jgi:tetratricopeptide (TPR) repeat protein